MKNEKEFIQEFKQLLDKYNYFIEYDIETGSSIFSNNPEDEDNYDSISLFHFGRKFENKS